MSDLHGAIDLCTTVWRHPLAPPYIGRQDLYPSDATTGSSMRRVAKAGSEALCTRHSSKQQLAPWIPSKCVRRPGAWRTHTCNQQRKACSKNFLVCCLVCSTSLYTSSVFPASVRTLLRCHISCTALVQDVSSQHSGRCKGVCETEQRCHTAQCEVQQAAQDAGSR
jgi:hypothetical protein